MSVAGHRSQISAIQRSRPPHTAGRPHMSVVRAQGPRCRTVRFPWLGEGDSRCVVTYGAEQRVRVPVLRAGWLTQTFVHWSFPVKAVQALVPAPLVVDEYEDRAWVGLTPFVMAEV